MIGWTQDGGRNGARTWLRRIYAAAAAAMQEPAYDQDAADGIVDNWRHLLPRAQMFYVAPAASTLVHHAAASLTGYKLHPEDLPADQGLLLFAQPLRDEAITDDPDGRPITLVTWTLRRNTVLLEFWCPNGYVEHSEKLGYTIPGIARVLADHGGKLPADWVPGQVYPRHGYLYQRIAPLVLHGAVDHDYLAGPWHDPDAPDDDDESRDSEQYGRPRRVYTNPHGDGSAATIELQKLVAATFLVMGQTIIAETRMPASTAEQTAARRRGESDPEVRYIDLRATKYPPRKHDSEPGGSGRVYRHSWYVQGHWRKQWYPSRGEHRPIWIDLHRAGPEDAPLIGGDRVNVLRR
ncbi:hypothetical protein ABH935_007028 [Catenulispora sp. GAS73]|uniref:hypothetical protein n=1 Tax=Catenulispora sp. GAS73 TaxID=3156269 RepID=UPI0035169B15